MINADIIMKHGVLEVDGVLPNLNHRTSSVQTDGSVVLSGPRRGSAIRNLFKRNRSTKFVLAGGDVRVPFLSIYQVNKQLSACICV